MRTIQKINFKFYLNKNRKNAKGHACYLRISVDGKRTEVKTPYNIELKYWDKKKNRMKTQAPRALIINNYFQQQISELEQFTLESTVKNKTLTGSQIKNRLLGIEDENNEKLKTICDAFDYHNNKMGEKVKSGQITRKTLLRYLSAKKKIVRFMQHEYCMDDKPLQELKLSFITEFEHYLLTQDELQQNTAHKVIKNAKKVVNQAVALEWIHANPFNSFKCSYKNPDRVVLTESEVEKIRNKEILIPRLDEVRDAFIFQCYTGFAYTDLYNFKRNSVSIGIDGEMWLSTFRQKTGTKENVPLLPVALEIIKKYENHERCIEKNQLLPVNSNSKYNAYLKEIMLICGIKKKITTHIARHTFATTITLSNGVPIETVSKLLGHTKLATTQIYAKVLENKISEDMQQLKQRLNAKPETKKVNQK